MSDDDDLIVASAAFIVISSLAKKKKKRRYWMTRLHHDRLLSRGPSFIQSLSKEEDGHFQNFVRMSSSDFSFILESIREKISRADTKFRRAVTAEERLAVTLRFLATGDSFTSLKYVFNISKSLISKIVQEVCQAIIEILKHYIQVRLIHFSFKITLTICRK